MKRNGGFVLGISQVHRLQNSLMVIQKSHTWIYLLAAVLSPAWVSFRDWWKFARFMEQHRFYHGGVIMDTLRKWKLC